MSSTGAPDGGRRLSGAVAAGRELEKQISQPSRNWGATLTVPRFASRPRARVGKQGLAQAVKQSWETQEATFVGSDKSLEQMVTGYVHATLANPLLGRRPRRDSATAWQASRAGAWH